MSSFQLTVASPNGCVYEGPAEFIKLRLTTGDVGIVANHAKYAAALGMGECHVKIGDTTRSAACIGGMLTVADNEVNVLATTFEWKEDIDLPRAERSLAESEEKLSMELDEHNKEIYLAKKNRALVRISVATAK